MGFCRLILVGIFTEIYVRKLSKVFKNNVMFGASMYYQQGMLDENDAIVAGEDTFNGLGVDFQLGYSPLEDLSLYGVAGYQVQALASSTSAGGIGYGAGISYKVFEHLAFALEYKTYDMEITDNNYKYDYDTLDAQIRFVW